MKTIFSIVGVLFFMNINAQKFDCSSKIKEYKDFFQAKKMDQAYDSWNEVRLNCPKEDEKIYPDGIAILEYKTDNATDTIAKEKLVRETMRIYDQYNKNFPLAIPDFEVQKAMLLQKRRIKAPAEIYALLESGFAKASASVTDATAIYTYYSLCYDKYKADNTKFPVEVLLDKYLQLNSQLDKLSSTKPEKSVEYKTAQRGMRALTKDLSTCETLSKYYELRFETNKDNAEWLNAALSNFTLKCGGMPIYNLLAETNYKLKATSKSAYYLANACLKQRKFPEAIQYFTEAEALETNPAEKALLDYSLATGLLSNDKPKSKALLLKAISLDPKLGRAYLFLGEMYGNAAEECGTTDIQKKTVYYLAMETLKKAITAEPRLKPTVDKMNSEYESKSWSAADISKAKLNGKSVKIDCWINETVMFPEK
ncbi:tetratricopeptide repeat protein [Flavobacterium sp. XGLA_31]|uniref:tetratricopeptide repeat protein n=1 Tax=Flavobacterium sp. XGLA_31 TaxID=3447666 RepID=UPI003F3518B7